MPTFQPCPKEVHDLAREILCAHDSHKPLLDARVKIDLVFAFAEEDEHGNPKGPAIKHNGYAAAGEARILKLKDRVMGRGDAEITLDGNWWSAHTVQKQRGLLDHELHHLAVKTDKHGRIELDDMRRPALALRKHDFQFGWFVAVAGRNGADSVEQEQAAIMMSAAGQFFWPGLTQSSAKPVKA